MSDSMNGTFGQAGLPPPDPSQRVERLDRDSPDRERRQQEEFVREKRRVHMMLQGEDKVEISPAAMQALMAAQQAENATTPPPTGP